LAQPTITSNRSASEFSTTSRPDLDVPSLEPSLEEVGLYEIVIDKMQGGPAAESSIASEPAAPISETEQSSFDRHIAARGLQSVRRARVSTLQLNIGLRCNLACHHCHVESGPKRVERLDRRGIERIIELLERNPDVATLDITGGAPELHPDFRDLVCAARSLGRKVIDRCNLTILFEPGQEDTAAFLADQGVDIVASLPCYSLKNVEQQRGRGVFDGSIRALQQLNSLGYGSSQHQTESGPRLDLVYNPVGAFLPPSQESLETEYRKELSSQFGIVFNRLLTITNMPIKRFAHELHREGQHEAYMGLLVNHFNANNVESLMCRSLVNVGYDGTLYDCDFNQALELLPPGPRRTIFDVDDFADLEGNQISTARHCFGCTSGAGSSCGGALS
jgi:radical SAM/Cys-rich protein